MSPNDTNNEDGGMQLKTQDHLMKQDAGSIDPTKLTALTPEVVSLLFSKRAKPHFILF